MWTHTEFIEHGYGTNAPPHVKGGLLLQTQFLGWGFFWKKLSYPRIMGAQSPSYSQPTEHRLNSKWCYVVSHLRLEIFIKHVLKYTNPYKNTISCTWMHPSAFGWSFVSFIQKSLSYKLATVYLYNTQWTYVVSAVVSPRQRQEELFLFPPP